MSSGQASTGRFLLGIVLVQGIALLAVIVLLVVGWVRLDSTGARLAAGLAAQTRNRTSNVAAWCGAIDRLDRSLTGYVASFGPRVRPLRLKALPCAQLERKTLASTRPR